MITVLGKEVPTEFNELVDPRSAALLIIDMQNDCCAVGGAAHQAGADLSMYEETIPRIASFAHLCRQVGIPVINVGIYSLPDGRSDSAAWIRMRMRANKNYNPENEGISNYMVEGTWGAEFIPELEPRPGDFLVRKFRSSAFHNTNLDLILRSNAIKSVLVSGCTTEGCVESTVRDLSFYDYFGIVLSDCVGSDVLELHEASMLVMSAYRADVFTSTEVSSAWRATCPPFTRPRRYSGSCLIATASEIAQ
jgi:nicotinamidase-related amidase